MTKKLEIERKYLVDFIDPWKSFNQLINCIVDIKRITQTYLKPEDGDPSVRIRKTVEGLKDDKKITFDKNQKFKVESGVHEEHESKISEEKYNSLMKNKRDDKFSISKTRVVFEYKDKLFELDIFNDHLDGLIILEIELSDINEKFDFPPFLKIEEDVTYNKNFNNFELASKNNSTTLNKR